MRLSLGQDLRLVQKQVLAPRMIQSMEILQLPILALEERIEQEMRGEPGPGAAGGGPGSAGRGGRAASRAEAPDAPSEEERELVIDETHSNEDDFERLLKMDEQWPDHFEERTPPLARRDRGGRRAEARRHGQHDRPAAIAARLPARPVGLVRARSRRCGRWPSGSSTTSTATATCKAAWKTCWAPTPTKEELALAEQALALVQKLDPPGVAARDLRECLLLQLTPGMPCYEQLQTLISSHLEDLEHNRLPVISRRTGYSIELIQATLVELRKLNPKPGAKFNDVARPAGHARRVHRAGRTRQVQGPPGRGPHAQPVHQPLLPQALRQRAGQRRDRASTSSGRSIPPNG